MPQVNDFDMSKYAHDFSGYVRAAEMRAQSMANIGQQIGAGITAFDEKRKEKKKKSEFENLVMPDLITKYDGDVETAKKAASSLYSNPEAYGMVQEMQQLEQAENKYQVDLAMLDQMESGNMTPNELLQNGVDLQMIKDYTSVMDATPESISTKKLASGQAYLDENNLVIKDGVLYKKNSGRFGWGGSATPVPNPEAYLNIEGIPELVAQSATGSGTVMVQPQDGWSSRALDAANAVNVPTEAAVSADALQNVTPSNPEGSRAGRFMSGLGSMKNSIDENLRMGLDTAQQMGVNAIASIPASAEYLFNEDDPSFDSNFKKYQAIASNFKPDFERFPSKEQVRAEASKRYY